MTKTELINHYESELKSAENSLEKYDSLPYFKSGILIKIHLISEFLKELKTLND